MFCQELNPSNPLTKPPKLVNIKSLESKFGRAKTLLFLFASVHRAVTSLFAFLSVVRSLKFNGYKASATGFFFFSVKPWSIKYNRML